MEILSHTTIDRAAWSRLRSSSPLMLSEEELDILRGANEPMSIQEVQEICLPLVRLISLHVNAARNLSAVTDEFIGRETKPRPFIVAIAGSVAVGKSTIARVLKLLLSRAADHPKVELVTTDGFLWPGEKLTRDGMMDRKGFPESYDVRRMIDFLALARAGQRATAPVYSHISYDIVPDKEEVIEGPDILIFEGLNVLQIGDGVNRSSGPVFNAADFFDLSIFVDAEPEVIERWYIDRFLLLQRTRMQDPASYFHHLADASREEATAFATRLWETVNLPNLMENIIPTRHRADVIIHKSADHTADYLLLRRI
jgi:type I pantothenate kinase